jgi:hypothetical protein
VLVRFLTDFVRSPARDLNCGPDWGIRASTPSFPRPDVIGLDVLVPKALNLVLSTFLIKTNISGSHDPPYLSHLLRTPATNLGAVAQNAASCGCLRIRRAFRKQGIQPSVVTIDIIEKVHSTVFLRDGGHVENKGDGVAIRLLATVPVIYSLSVAPGTQTLLGARSLVLGWVSTLTYWSPPLFLGTARKTR